MDLTGAGNGERAYNAPVGDPNTGEASSVGTQFNTSYYQKKALIEARKEQYFSQLADTMSMPKHYGKTIKRYHYMPLLDDANINDQGIDVSGLSVPNSVTITITPPGGDGVAIANPGAYLPMYAVGEGVDAAAAYTAAQAELVAITGELGLVNTDFATSVTSLTDAGYLVTDPGAAGAVPQSGNLYGSSKDVGTIADKMPALSEHGGRVNRVGFRRIELEGSLEKFGFFDEYTQESLDFDTDSQLQMHVHREMLNGANEITEDALQIDLLNNAGVVRYGGIATSTDELTGEGADISLISYEDLMRLSIDLDNNRCPKNTKVISGTRMIDTRVINAARIMYIGSELIPSIKKMVDLFGNQAFISVEQYAAAGNLLNGEIGTVDQFRIVVVPEMMHWAGAGAAATGANTGYRETGGAYDVFPMLVVGSESFTTIGFQTDGKTVKFKITHKKPGSAIANRDDPYGEVGFMSIKWYYGFMVLRPERIALCKVVAEY